VWKSARRSAGSRGCRREVTSRHEPDRLCAEEMSEGLIGKPVGDRGQEEEQVARTSFADAQVTERLSCDATARRPCQERICDNG